MSPRGVLTVAATPIGNPRDASTRLVDALGSSDVIVAEDTRKIRRLATDLGVCLSAKPRAFHEGSEERLLPDLVAELGAGRSVLLVSDAGMPTVSDPGFRLVRAATQAGAPVTVLPGPSAITAALAISGLPTDRFCFEGFLPRRAGERRRRVDGLAVEPRTMVILESRHRLAATLAALVDGLGADRPAALCRELTKTHEEVVRAPLGELAAWADEKADSPLGEITLVVAGRTSSAAGCGDMTHDALASRVAERIAAGDGKKEAITAVSRATGLPRRVVYDAAVGVSAAPARDP